MEGANWSDAHEAELEFTREKKKARLVQAWDEGLVLPSEDTLDLAEEAEDKFRKMADAQAKRDKEIKTRSRLRQGQGQAASASDLRGLHAYTQHGKFRPALTANGHFMIAADELLDAEVFVVADIAGCPLEIRLAAVLVGGWLLSHEALQSGRGVDCTNTKAYKSENCTFLACPSQADANLWQGDVL